MLSPHPTAPDPEAVARALTRERRVLFALAPQVPAAAAALELLDRDLLPRCSGGAGDLVCGIVGPNNSGKSALFNALAGRTLSPSEPTGGATRRLVGAAHSSLLERLHADPQLSRFHMRVTSAPEGSLRAALQVAGDPAELLAVAVDTMPPHLLLIDTPDFDSILADHRATSESLLAVADLVVAVVTKHSYQNRAVVEFFRQWLRHGRPWILVYNEAIDANIAAAHADKLISDVGSAPMAAYWAVHDLAVARGEKPLSVVPLAAVNTAAAGTLAQRDLAQLLLESASAREVKALAFTSALARLNEQLREVERELERRESLVQRILAAAEGRAAELGRSVASRAMPAGPFVEAFRAVLDRRTNALSRAWRTLVRGVRTGIERVPDLLRGNVRKLETPRLEAVESDALRLFWPTFWENLSRDLGPEARHEARRAAPAALVAQLDAELLFSEADKALQRAMGTLASGAADLGGFREACERLIDEAIEKRGFDTDIQAAADLATLAPIAFATVFIFTTSGVGADLAAAGGGAVGTFLLEKYSHVLGSSITRAARSRWAELRGRQIADAAVAAALPHVVPALRMLVADGQVARTALQRLRQEIR